MFLPHAFFVTRKPFAEEVKLGRLPLPTSILSMLILGPLTFWALHRAETEKWAKIVHFSGAKVD